MFSKCGLKVLSDWLCYTFRSFLRLLGARLGGFRLHPVLLNVKKPSDEGFLLRLVCR